MPLNHLFSIVSENEKVEVEGKVEEALEENFEKHDNIAKIHQGDVELNGGLDAFFSRINLGADP